MADNFNILDQPSGGGGGVFSESFESAEQTITQAGDLTVAHGLSATPTLLQALIICKVAESGYSVGDTLVMSNGFGPLGSTDSSRGIALWADATNVRVQYANDPNLFAIASNVNGNFNTITHANWRLILRAWA